jgi:hypothetical protein
MMRLTVTAASALAVSAASLLFATSSTAAAATSGETDEYGARATMRAEAAQTSPIEATADRGSSDHDGDAKVEHVRVGVVGGVGFPRPLSIEAMVKLERIVSFGLEYSAMPTTTVNGVMVGWHALALDARLFPFRGAFFLGARLARQHLDGSATVNAGAYGSYSGAVAIDTWYLEPRIGFLWTFRSGITVGIDAGLELPLQKTATASLPAGVAVPSAVATVRDFFGASTLPTVTLLSVGALF